MKILTIIFRSLMGLLFLFASLTYFFHLITPPEPVGNMKIFNEGLMAAVYLLPLVKTIELLCGLSFLVGRYVALASVLIAPIIVNIFLIHVFLDPKSLPIGVFLVVANSLVAYSQREQYKALFKA